MSSTSEPFGPTPFQQQMNFEAAAVIRTVWKLPQLDDEQLERLVDNIASEFLWRVAKAIRSGKQAELEYIGTLVQQKDEEGEVEVCFKPDPFLVAKY